MNSLKKNVDVYNKEVECYGGYEYNINNKFSSIVANKRITDTVIENISAQVRTIIDIGCGDGSTAANIKKARPSVTICGTDPAANAMENAKNKYRDIDFFVSNILDKDSLPKNHFDLVILKGVIHHVADQQLAIRNAASLADYLLLVEPNGNNPLLKIIEKTSKYHIEHEEQSFTTSVILNWCKNADLEIIKQKYIGFVPFFFPTLPAKLIYFFQPLLEKIPIINKYLSAQVVMLCKKKTDRA